MKHFWTYAGESPTTLIFLRLLDFFTGLKSTLKETPPQVGIASSPENYRDIDNKVIHLHTVKPVWSGHSKIDKTKVLKTNGSLMKAKRIAECSDGAFCNTFDLH